MIKMRKIEHRDELKFDMVLKIDELVGKVDCIDGHKLGLQSLTNPKASEQFAIDTTIAYLTIYEIYND